MHNKYKFKEQEQILWITGSHYKTGDGLQYYTGDQVIAYVKKKKELFELLSEEVRSKIVYRSLYHLREMFFDEFSSICSKKALGNEILPHMLSAKIILLDYYGTPLYEAFALNVPIILVLLEARPCFTEEAENLFKKLKNCGILFYNLQEAAKFLHSVQEKEILDWWSSSRIQSVRGEFLEKYANCKPYFWIWAKEIFLGKF